jgi:hypothetical protein
VDHANAVRGECKSIWRKGSGGVSGLGRLGVAEEFGGLTVVRIGVGLWVGGSEVVVVMSSGVIVSLDAVISLLVRDCANRIAVVSVETILWSPDMLRTRSRCATTIVTMCYAAS